MITLDQVLLLQEKVETAVEKIVSLEAKIQQLTSDNDAWREKCSELTKALTEKTELISNLQITQSKIESGILSALNRLDAVENSVLSGNEENSSSESPEFLEDTTASENTASGAEETVVVPNPSANNSNNSDTDNFDIF